MGPAVFFFVGGFVAAVAFLEGRCDLLGPLGLLSYIILLGIGHCFFYCGWLSKELCAVVMSASSNLSFEMLLMFASFASLRNSEKNPEADWFVPGSRLVSLYSLMCIGCRFSKDSSRIFMYEDVCVSLYIFFGRGLRPGGLTAWVQGRYTSTRLAALSAHLLVYVCIVVCVHSLDCVC